MEHPVKNTNWIQLGGAILILLLASEVVLLIIQNRELKKALNSMTAISQVEPLKPGERVESVKIQTLDGSFTELQYTDPTKKYLLFVLSTTCPHCEKTLPVWQSFAQNKSDNCSVLGLCIHNLDQTRKFLAAKNVGFYTASVEQDTSFGRKYKIGGVPETILINGNGIVEKAWVGELNQDQVNEISALIGGTRPSLN